MLGSSPRVWGTDQFYIGKRADLEFNPTGGRKTLLTSQRAKIAYITRTSIKPQPHALLAPNPAFCLSKATDELSKSGTLRDETLSELLDKFGETISRKIVLMIAWFNLLSRFLNGCRVPLETTDKIGTGISPLANSGGLAA